MTESIPRDFFERPTFAHITTLYPDGRPHTTPVWIDALDDCLLVNTEIGRQKERNVRRDPRVSVSMLDPENPYRFCSVNGRVTAFQTDGAKEHIDRLAQRYVGVDEYPIPVQTERVILHIEPDEAMYGERDVQSFIDDE